MIATALATPFLLLGFKFRIPPFTDLILISIANLCFLAGFYLFYRAINSLDATVTAPLMQIQSVVLVILSAIFLKQNLSGAIYLWLTILLIGTGLLASDGYVNLKAYTNKAIWMILAMQFLHGINNLLVGIALETMGNIEVLFWQNLLTSVILFGFLGFKAINLRNKYHKTEYLPLMISTWIGTVGAIFLFKAFSLNLAVSGILGLMSAPIVFIITLILGLFKSQLLETNSLKVYLVRFSGLLLIMSAVVAIIRL